MTVPTGGAWVEGESHRFYLERPGFLFGWCLLGELTRYPATPHMLYEGWGWFTRWVASNGSKRSHAVLNRYALAGMGYRTPEAARSACSAVVAAWVLSGELRHVA